ncbi:hypothetical protein H7F33_12900 [Pedobacter sp. PAMC26386]|nr:hypothetical protein H7F33_12900 [Pedobacter sp. PAMC26386]
MKQTTLFLLLVSILAFNAHSQVNSLYSVGVNAFSIMQLPRISNQNPIKYINTSFKGGIFKVNDRQISYRLSGSFVNQSIEFQDNCTNCELDKGKVTDYSAKLGFEKSFNYSRIQPYFAFDIGYRYNRFNGFQNFIDLKKTISSTSQIEATKNGLTLSPSLGLRITPIELISIFAEASIEFYYSSLRTQTRMLDQSALMTLNSEHKKEFLFTPITIGLQIHLGNGL